MSSASGRSTESSDRIHYMSEKHPPAEWMAPGRSPWSFELSGLSPVEKTRMN